MFNKTLENLTFEDIEWLISNSVVENQNIEYKKEVWGKSDSDKKEMLKDIVSMANRHGGFIVAGLEEDGEGKAAKIIDVPDAENDRDRILSSLFANTQPRLQSVKIRSLEKGEKKVLVISVPNSFKKPHMITFNGSNQFWVRHDRQKMLMTIGEIQEAVVSTVNITKDIDLFFNRRKNSIIEDIGDTPLMVLGASPMSVENEVIDIYDRRLRDLLKNAPSIRNGGANFEFNYKQPQPSYYGLIVVDDDYRQIELHRNGYLEGMYNMTNSIVQEGESKERVSVIRNWSIVEVIYSFARQVKQIYEYIGYDGQVVVYCNMYNIKNLFLCEYQEGILPNPFKKWPKNNLEIGPLMFTEINDVDIAKKISDRIWQSFGFEQEPYLWTDFFSK